MSHLERACDAASLFREALGFGLVYGPLIPAHQWNEMREEKVAQLVARLATPPAQPAPAKIGTIGHIDNGKATLTASILSALQATKPAAQPAVPDAITDSGEDPKYRAGWNECRETMLEMMK
jgi:hypothetical protein